MANAREVKPRDAEKTKARILTSSFKLFSERGYAKTGTRDVAELAGVAQSLIAKHFGNKANLFEQSLIQGIYNNSLFVEDKLAFGEKMAKLVVSKSNPQLPAMVVLAIADPQAMAIAQKVSQSHIVEPLAKWIGPPNANARALNMLTLLNGFTIQMRYLGPGKAAPASVKWLAQALQDIVDNR